MYKAIGHPGSRLSRVTWMLEELEQPYEIVKTKQHSDTMRRYNPSGKMPALEDGDVVVTDSAAICIYLADKHPEKDMGADPGPAGRAAMDSWMHFAQSELEAPLWNKMRHKFILAEDLRADVSKATAHDFAREIMAFEAKLGNRQFALGDRFSEADVILGHCGQWARGGKFEIASDTVNAYFDRVLSRPALKRAREKEATA